MRPGLAAEYGLKIHLKLIEVFVKVELPAAVFCVFLSKHRTLQHFRLTPRLVLTYGNHAWSVSQHAMRHPGQAEMDRRSV